METVSKRCDHCSSELPDGMRSDARYCNSTCRSAQSHERKRKADGAKFVKGHWRRPRGSVKRRRRVIPGVDLVSPVMAALDAQVRSLPPAPIVEEETTRSCVHCGRRFEPRAHGHVYCTVECRREATGVLPPPTPMERDCAVCGDKFVTVNRLQRICSPRCRAVASTLRVHAQKETIYYLLLLNDPCSYCGAPATAGDHIEPRARGGADNWDNFTAACTSCNSAKGDRPMLTFMLRRAESVTVHSRSQP